MDLVEDMITVVGELFIKLKEEDFFNRQFSSVSGVKVDAIYSFFIRINISA